MTSNIVQCLGAMLSTVAFRWKGTNEKQANVILSCSRITIKLHTREKETSKVLWAIFFLSLSLSWWGDLTEDLLDIDCAQNLISWIGSRQTCGNPVFFSSFTFLPYLLSVVVFFFPTTKIYFFIIIDLLLCDWRNSSHHFLSDPNWDGGTIEYKIRIDGFIYRTSYIYRFSCNSSFCHCWRYWKLLVPLSIPLGR